MAAIRKKLVAVGNYASGKTRMLYAFTRNDLHIKYFPTVFENYVADIEVDGKLVELALWDTNGLSTAHLCHLRFHTVDTGLYASFTFKHLP